MKSESSNVQCVQNVQDSRATKFVLDGGGGTILIIFMGPAATPEGSAPDGQPELTRARPGPCHPITQIIQSRCHVTTRMRRGAAGNDKNVRQAANSPQPSGSSPKKRVGSHWAGKKRCGVNALAAKNCDRTNAARKSTNDTGTYTTAHVGIPSLY